MSCWYSSSITARFLSGSFDSAGFRWNRKISARTSKTLTFGDGTVRNDETKKNMVSKCNQYMQNGYWSPSHFFFCVKNLFVTQKNPTFLGVPNWFGSPKRSFKMATEVTGLQPNSPYDLQVNSEALSNEGSKRTPTYPWSIPHESPFTPKWKESLHFKLLVLGRFGMFQGYVG